MSKLCNKETNKTPWQAAPTGLNDKGGRDRTAAAPPGDATHCQVQLDGDDEATPPHSPQRPASWKQSIPQDQTNRSTEYGHRPATQAQPGRPRRQAGSHESNSRSPTGTCDLKFFFRGVRIHLRFCACRPRRGASRALNEQSSKVGEKFENAHSCPNYVLRMLTMSVQYLQD